MKKYSSFLLCLAISSVIWVMRELSQPSSDVVSVQVVALSNLDGYAVKSAKTAPISVRCRTSGFRLLALSGRNRKPVTVKFDPGDFTYVEDGVFVMPSSYVHKYSEQIFGSDVTIENIVSQDITFRFSPEDHKKVPVAVVRTLDFRPQYMPLEDIRTDPDSIVIYGNPDLIASIDKVLTVPVSMNDIHSDISGVVKLAPMRSVRYSAQEVNFYQAVTRYVEIVSEIPIQMVNVPRGKNISIYPGTAKVSFNCSFPMPENPSENIRLYVDYDEYASSLSGNCLIRSRNVSKGVINYRIEPQICECFEIVDK